MTTTLKEMLHAMATLLGCTRYNDYLDPRQPATIQVKAAHPQPGERH